MKKWILAVVVLLLAGGGWFVWYQKKAPAATATAAEQTLTAKVEKGAIRVAVTSTGRVVSNLDVDIKCKASGEIVALPFDVSDSVEKGQLLVELDPIDEQRRVKQAEVATSSSMARLEQARLNLSVAARNLATERQRAEAALRSAEARANDARSKADRLKDLLAKQLASQEEYDTAETSAVQAAADLESARARIDDLKTQEISIGLRREDLQLAEAQMESNRIDLQLAQQRLRDTRVFAPMDAVVAARNVQIGQIISSAINNVGGGTTVLVLSDLSRLFVLAAVDESDVGKVREGQEANITVDAYPGMPFRGRVDRVATRGVSTSNVVTFEVKIEVLSRNKQMLKPEMTANVEIVAQEKQDILLLPVAAVGRDKMQRVVKVKAGEGEPESRPVEVGITDGVNIEVVSGVAEGDTIVYRPGEAESRWRSMGQQGRGMPESVRMRMMMGGGGRGR